MAVLITETDDFFYRIEYTGEAGRQVAGFYPHMEYEILSVGIGPCKTPEAFLPVPKEYFRANQWRWIEEQVEDDIGANAGGPDPDYLRDSARDDELTGWQP